MVYKGDNIVLFWGIEGTFGEGDPSTETHQPPNKLEKVKLARADYEIAEKKTADSLVPNMVYTALRKVGEVTLNFWYKDPMLGLTSLGNKTITGDFASASQSTIDGDFSSWDDRDSIWMYLCLKDAEGSADLDKLAKGCVITKRCFIAEVTDDANKVLREELSFKSADLEDFDGSEETFSNDSDFDDGKYADWHTEYRQSYQTELSFNGNAINTSNWGLVWKRCEIGYNVPETMQHIASSLVAQEHWVEELDPYCELTAYLTGDSVVDELESKMASRTTGTLKLLIDDATNLNKYVQFTNAYIKTIEGLSEPPKAGNAQEVTLTFKGDDPVWSEQWNYDDDTHADPSSRITTS
jgi:hypothetical protein